MEQERKAIRVVPGWPFSLRVQILRLPFPWVFRGTTFGPWYYFSVGEGAKQVICENIETGVVPS